MFAIIGTIRGTARDKIHKELGVEGIQSKRKLNRSCTFYKIKIPGLPPYFFRVT